MMRIRLKTTMAGPAGVYQPDEVADFDDALALALLEGGYAERVESAMVAAPETAVLPPPSPRVVREPIGLPDLVAEYAEVLAELDITTAAQLLAADDTQLARSISGVGPATVRRWKAAARALLEK